MRPATGPLAAPADIAQQPAVAARMIGMLVRIELSSRLCR
jgi:hypothetical protein